jgi:hypothetical protein
LSFRAGSEQRGECWLRKILFNLLGFSVVEKRQEKTICLKLLVYLLSYLAKLLRTCSPFLLLDVTEIKINERNIFDFSSKYFKSRWEPKFLHIFPKKKLFSNFFILLDISLHKVQFKSATAKRHKIDS